MFSVPIEIITKLLIAAGLNTAIGCGNGIIIFTHETDLHSFMKQAFLQYVNSMLDMKEFDYKEVLSKRLKADNKESRERKVNTGFY